MKTTTIMVICFIANSPMVLLISSISRTSCWFHLDWQNCFPACSWIFLSHSSKAPVGISWAGGFHPSSCHTGNDGFIKHEVSISIPILFSDWSLLVWTNSQHTVHFCVSNGTLFVFFVLKNKNGVFTYYESTGRQLNLGDVAFDYELQEIINLLLEWVCLVAICPVSFHSLTLPSAQAHTNWFVSTGVVRE